MHQKYISFAQLLNYPATIDDREPYNFEDNHIIFVK